MENNEKVKVEAVYTYPLVISGNKAKCKEKCIALKNSAQYYGGIAIFEQEIKSEMYITFAFKNLQLMEVWKSNINTL